ncbi:MAG: hypothetical protein U9Q83_03155 [Bacteroidota bacterium]|nr:hypothetical protein [Bacteroidota bacterium]
MIKEIFDTFTWLSDNDQSIEISLDDDYFDSLETINRRPEKYPEYQFLILQKNNIMKIHNLT